MSKVKSMEYDKPVGDEKSCCRIYIDLDGAHTLGDDTIVEMLISYWYDTDATRMPRTHRIHCIDPSGALVSPKTEVSDDPLFVVVARIIDSLEEKP